MNITQLYLENFRSAKAVRFVDDLAFDTRINVFASVNGSGKSTILEALAILLSWLSARIRSSQGSGYGIEADDINNDASSASIGVVAEHLGRSYHWTVAKNRPGRQHADAKSSYVEASGLSKALVEGPEPLYPVLAFYPVTRAVIDIPLRIRKKHEFSPLNAYENSLSSAADFRTFFEWFREREDIENELRLDSDEGARDYQLEAVRSALSRFLPGFSKLKVRRSPLRMEVVKGGKTLWVNQLSDGEKCLLALVGDLARRLAIAHEHGGKDVLSGEGIVLIDEVDLHLHPEWQRIVIPSLVETFPNCQFFVSTHSPLVLSQLKPQSLFMLQNDGQGLTVTHPTESYGKNSVRVLEDLMGLPTTHPDVVAENLKTIFKQIADNQIQAARSGIADLRAEGFYDPELRRAETLIRRKELIGK